VWWSCLGDKETCNRGVEAGAGEAGAGRAVEVLGGFELGFEVGLHLVAAVVEGGAVVEALVGGIYRREGGEYRQT
jgi:hypothetical protein